MVTDMPLTRLVDDIGDSRARATWDSGLAAIARIEAIVRDEQIDCAFERVPGYFHASRPDEDKTRFEQEASASMPTSSSPSRSSAGPASGSSVRPAFTRADIWLGWCAPQPNWGSESTNTATCGSSRTARSPCAPTDTP